MSLNRERSEEQSMSETTKSAANGAGKKYMTDDRGNPSSMRLMSMLALGVAAVLALVEAFGLGSGESKTELVLYFLVAAFAPKAVQKFAEKDRT